MKQLNIDKGWGRRFEFEDFYYRKSNRCKQ